MLFASCKIHMAKWEFGDWICTSEIEQNLISSPNNWTTALNIFTAHYTQKTMNKYILYCVVDTVSSESKKNWNSE